MNANHQHSIHYFCTASLALVLALVTSATGAQAQEWGSLKGKLVVDGAAPAPLKITPTKDVDYCGHDDLFDETVVVGEGGGLANAFIYLYLKSRDTVDVHPDYESAASEPVMLYNKGCRFEPHALLVLTGQELQIHNSDPGIGHNTNASLLKNPAFNEIVSNDSPINKTFEKAEPQPAGVACNVHPWMKAHMLIRDNPYMALTGEDGSFEIKNLPAGEHEFIFWHEGPGNLKNLALGSAGKTNRRGRAKLEIPAGETLDLGEIKVKPADLGL